MSVIPLVPRRRLALAVLHLCAGAFVVAGVLAQVARPLAPPLGVPPDAQRWFTAEHLSRVADYRTPIYYALLVALILRLAVVAWVALSARGRGLTDRLVNRVGGDADQPGPARPARAAAFVAVALVAAADVAVLPVAFWVGYVHEGHYGFRTQGLRGWGIDWLVGVAPAWLAVGVLVLGGYALARRLPQLWPPVAGLSGGLLALLVVFAAPLVLEPLEFDLRRLPSGPARAEVERVLARAGTQVDVILVADASRRTTKANAYVSGLGSTRRVVLYDNLLAQHPPDEVGLVLAHELGHDLHRDVARNALLGIAGVIIVVYVVAFVMRRRAAHGRQRGIADPAAVPVVVLVVLLLNLAGQPVEAFFSRRGEAAADLAALELTQNPQVYLDMTARLARAHLADPSPPLWAYVLWFSHPVVTSRLELGARWPFDDVPAHPGGEEVVG